MNFAVRGRPAWRRLPQIRMPFRTGTRSMELSR